MAKRDDKVIPAGGGEVLVIGSASKARVVVNAAPALNLRLEDLQSVDVFIANEPDPGEPRVLLPQTTLIPCPGTWDAIVCSCFSLVTFSLPSSCIWSPILPSASRGSRMT